MLNHLAMPHIIPHHTNTLAEYDHHARRLLRLERRRERLLSRRSDRNHAAIRPPGELVPRERREQQHDLGLEIRRECRRILRVVLGTLRKLVEHGVPTRAKARQMYAS